MPVLPVTTAERSLGAALTGAMERGEIAAPIRLVFRGAAGQSFGAWAGTGVSLVLEGIANDYVGKGLSGGTLVIRPAERADSVAAEPAESVAASLADSSDLAASFGSSGSAAAPAFPASPAGGRSFTLAGNTCLYGATAGRLHIVGGAGMRFAIRNSGAEAVVEGVGPHGCEYMTGGTVVVLGPVGQSFGAGMTGGRAYLWDPAGRHVAALHAPSVRATRVSEAAIRPDGDQISAQLRRLLTAHRDAGSALAARLVDAGAATEADVWIVEPVSVESGAAVDMGRSIGVEAPAATQPNRNRAVA
jgi:glutamate synthase domain-containing protein 3